MAKEMILIPKIKYEHLRKIQNDEQCVQKDLSNHEDHKTNTTQSTCATHRESNSNTVNEMHEEQSGGAYVSNMKTVDGPPGVSRTKRKRQKKISWLTY